MTKEDEHGDEDPKDWMMGTLVRALYVVGMQKRAVGYAACSFAPWLLTSMYTKTH